MHRRCEPFESRFLAPQGTPVGDGKSSVERALTGCAILRRAAALSAGGFRGVGGCARLRGAVLCAEIFAARTADGWNFGLCATIPRKPRQARKGATVAGQSRVPRSTRSSSSRGEWVSKFHNIFDDL